MTDIFECPVLQYKNRRRRFRVTDVSGRLLAETVPVHGGEGAGVFAKDFSESYDTSAFLLQSSGPDGETLFFIERVEGEPVVFVLDADHRTVGRISGISAEDHGRRLFPRDCFVDADEEPLGTIVWEKQKRSWRVSVKKRHCDFVAVDGRRFGRFERDVLRLDHRFDRPLHTLIIAAPIIFHIKSGG